MDVLMLRKRFWVARDSAACLVDTSHIDVCTAALAMNVLSPSCPGGALILQTFDIFHARFQGMIGYTMLRT